MPPAYVLFIFVCVVHVNFDISDVDMAAYMIPLVHLVLVLVRIHSSWTLMLNNNCLMCGLSRIYTSLFSLITITSHILVRV